MLALDGDLSLLLVQLLLADANIRLENPQWHDLLRQLLPAFVRRDEPENQGYHA